MEENNERSFGCAYVTSDFTLEKAENIQLRERVNFPKQKKRHA